MATWPTQGCMQATRSMRLRRHHLCYCFLSLARIVWSQQVASWCRGIFNLLLPSWPPWACQDIACALEFTEFGTRPIPCTAALGCMPSCLCVCSGMYTSAGLCECSSWGATCEHVWLRACMGLRARSRATDCSHPAVAMLGKISRGNINPAHAMAGW